MSSVPQPPPPPPNPPPAAPVPAAHEAGPPLPSPTVAQQRLAKEQEVLARLRVQFPTAVLGERTFQSQLWIDIAPESLRHVLRFLRDDAGLEFKYLVDLTCADYLKLPAYARARFGLTYVLFSFKLDTRIRLKAWVGAGGAEVASVADVYPAANWAEREVFDLYGIKFSGHPQLKRILMPEDYEGYPLRKDYPLKGRGERDSFPVLSRRES